MQLDEYLAKIKKNKISQKAFARLVGVHPSYITHIKNRRKIPTFTVALAIERITNSEVKTTDLLGIDDISIHINP